MTSATAPVEAKARCPQCGCHFNHRGDHRKDDGDYWCERCFLLSSPSEAVFPRAQPQRTATSLRPQPPNPVRRGDVSVLAPRHTTGNDLVLGPAAPQGETEYIDIDPPAEERGVPFPVDALRVSMMTFCLETAKSLEVEPEMVIVPALVAAGAAIGNSRCLQLKTNYRESPQLWAAIVARPGSVKTAAIFSAAEPLRRHERKLHTANLLAQRRYDNDLANWSETKPGDRQGLNLTRPDEPVAKRVVIGSTTMEELAYILQDNPRGVLELMDELSGWASSMNQYKNKSRGDDRQNYLSIWSNVEMSVDRRGTHGNPVRVWRPFVAVTSGIQPDMLRELRPERGRDDGFIDRILFAWPSPRIRLWNDTTVDKWVLDQYGSVTNKLLDLQPECDQDGYEQPVPVFWSDEGHRAWVRLYNQHHAEMAGADFDARMHGAYAKLDAYAARLALILHLWRLAADETRDELVDAETIENAWRIVNYFKSGARRVYGQMEQTADDRLIESAIGWMNRHGKTHMTASECLGARLPGVKEIGDVRNLFLHL
jgi:Protein of unknown function (DUF3987)